MQDVQFTSMPQVNQMPHFGSSVDDGRRPLKSVAILAGGLGTRLSEETLVKPKPLVDIGERPMLWHIMKMYAAQGFTEFVIALGYKGEMIKDFFLNYRHHNSSLTVKLRTGEVTVRNTDCEDWTIHLLDSGLNTQTGGRVRRVAQFMAGERFMLTYGDGIANIDLSKLISFHNSHGRTATVTAVRPPARFGGIGFNGDYVAHFEEKPQSGEGWINGGFFVFEPSIRNYIASDEILLEKEPMEGLARDEQLAAYRHTGFWQCMDTLRDVRYLESLWNSGAAPWKIWT